MKVYGICEDKCRVRLPRIIKNEYAYAISALGIAANSFETKSVNLADDLQDSSWFVIPRVTSSDSLAGLKVSTQIKDNKIYCYLINTKSTALTAKQVSIKFLLIEAV